MPTDVPTEVKDDRARVVIVGGGVAGTSIAYHLTKMGWDDVLLIDRSELTSGSTFHSAGLVAQLRNSVSHTRMMMYGVELYPTLERETGRRPRMAPGRDAPSRVVALPARGARPPGRLGEELRPARRDRLLGRRRSSGSPDRRLERARGAVRADGRAPGPDRADDGVRRGGQARRCEDPDRRSRAGDRGSRRAGNGRRHGPRRDRGRGRRERLGDLGQRARAAGRGRDPRRADGAPVPHHAADRRGHRRFPTLRDPDNLVYVREEVGGLVVGGYERNPDPWHVDTPIPADFNHRLLQERWERFEPIAGGAFNLIPALRTTEINRFINGPEAFTPDDDFILGETEVGGFFVAAGFCAHGITGGAGVGRYTAEWIVDGEPSMDLSKMDVRRFGKHYRSRRYALARAHEIYAKHYDVKYPGEDYQAGRPLKALAYVLAAGGARRRVRREGRLGAGELVPFQRGSGVRDHAAAGMGGRALVDRDRGRARGDARARWTVRRDQLRQARGLGSARVRLPPADLRERRRRAGRPRGLHPDAEPPGGIQCDLTVTRLSADRFRIVTGTASGSLDLAWIVGLRGDADDVEIRDVTSSLACLGLWGSARARHPLVRLPGRPLERRLSLHDVTRDDRGRRSVSGAPRDVRRRARMGALRSHRVRRGAVRHVDARPASHTDCSRPGTERSTRCGWRRGTGRGGRT